MIKFFSDLTRSNWGFPWHLWLSGILAGGFYPLLHKWLGQHRLWTAIIVFTAVMIIGYLNEIIDRDADKSEFWQDMTANAIGIIVALALAQLWFL